MRVVKNVEMENLPEKLLKVSQALLAWIVLILLFPFLVMIFGSLYIWKYGVLWVIIKLFKRKLLEGFHDSEAIFAIDRYWESSRSCIGLIVELEGSINIDTFRDEFRKKVLDYSLHHNADSSSSVEENSTTTPKPFAKLMQIPATFGGYYYWQKANYFLIHEHIRQINQPTDELGLKKAVGTLMSLPFPNRRPLWEILVYSNYLGTSASIERGLTCGSALFIRFHRSLTDGEGLMNLLRHMMTLSSSEKSIKSVQVASGNSDKEPANNVQKNNDETTKRKGVYNLIFKKLTSLVFLPLRAFHFAQEVIRVPNGIAKSNGCGEWDSGNASWTSLSDVLVRKICSSQLPSLSREAVEMSLFLEGMTTRGTHKCPNVPEEKGVAVQEGEKCEARVLVPVASTQSKQTPELMLTNNKSFITVTCPCVSSLTSSKTAVIRSVNNQFQLGQSRGSRQVCRVYLRLLSLLPRHILRYLLMSKKWGAGCFIYEKFPEGPHEKDILTDKGESKLFELYTISQVVPLVGLQWTYTVASAVTLKWQGNIVMSLIANAGVLGPMSQGNPQEHAERIVRGLPEELDKLADEAEDHGFVSIPIS